MTSTSSPDYKTYTVEELLDVLSNINREKYPERVAVVCNELERRAPTLLSKLDCGETEEETCESTIHSQEERFEIKINFPKFKMGVRTIRNFIYLVLMVYGLRTILEFELFHSFVIAFSIIILIATFLVIHRQRSYVKFLGSLGIRISRSEFYKGELLMSLVPFNGYYLMCSARVDSNNLIFGKARHYRSLPLEKIDSFELKTCYGQQVAKVNLSSDVTLGQALYVPWNNNMENMVDKFCQEQEENECSE